MRFLQIVLLLTVVVSVNAGKIVWGSNGKPIIAKSNKPVKGCHQGGLETMSNDANKTKVPCK